MQKWWTRSRWTRSQGTQLHCQQLPPHSLLSHKFCYQCSHLLSYLLRVKLSHLFSHFHPMLDILESSFSQLRNASLCRCSNRLSALHSPSRSIPSVLQRCSKHHLSQRTPHLLVLRLLLLEHPRGLFCCLSLLESLRSLSSCLQQLYHHLLHQLQLWNHPDLLRQS